MQKIINEAAQLVEIETKGTLIDAKNPLVKLSFRSNRKDLTKRSLEIIGRIQQLIRLAQNGKDPTVSPVYYKRYQPFIDANTSEFEVEVTSRYQVQR